MVSIVTPSLNMARFLDATIQSLLAQNYSPIEYIVLDACSTDGTGEILKRYEGQIQVVIARDDGPADAIHKGFARAKGEILAWLSADDVLLPEAIRAAVIALEANPAAAGVYGDADWIDENGRPLGSYPTEEFDLFRLERECLICQPACFFRKSAYEAAGGIDKTLHYTFDWDLWIRMSRRAPFVHVAEHWAQSRMHPANLTLGQKGKVLDESLDLLRRHSGYIPVRWVYGWMTYQDQPSDQFFNLPPRSPLRYLRTLLRGAKWNRGQIGRYAGEWVQGLRAYRPSANRPDRG